MFFLALLIVLGAISSIGVALGDALLDKPTFARWNRLGWTKSEEYAWREWNVTEYRGFASVALYRSKPSSRGEMLIPIGGRLPWWCPDLSSQVRESCEFAHGWPVPALRVSWLRTKNEFSTAAAALDKGLIVEPIHIPWLHDPPAGVGGGTYYPAWSEVQVSIRSAIPLRPIPMGLVVDGVVHGAIWLGVISMFALPVKCRRWLRRRKGACAACGYSLRGSPSTRCSECGWEVAHRAIFPSRRQFAVTLGLVCAMTSSIAALILLIVDRVVRPDQMHVAAAQGDLEALRQLLESGHPVDARAPQLRSLTPWPENSTPLMWAAAHGQIEAMQVLVAAGADVNAKYSIMDNSAIQAAIRNGSPDSIRFLLEHGASLAFDSSIPNAASVSRTDVLTLLVEVAGEQLEDSILHRAFANAAGSGRVDNLRYLLSTEFETRAAAIQAALERAVVAGNPQTARMLLDAGAVPGVSSEPLLWQAAQQFRVDVARLLLEHGDDPNREFRGEMGHAPLRNAIYYSNEPVARLLIAHGANPKVVDDRGETLHFRINWYAASDALAELLVEQGIAIDHQSVDGNTALMNAAFLGQARGVKRLLAAGANPLIRNGKDQNALDLARLGRTMSGVEYGFGDDESFETILAVLSDAMEASDR